MRHDELQGFELSPQQKRWWGLYREAPSAGGALGAWVAVDGALDEAALERALGEVVEHHEILRTGFRRLPGMKLPVQVVGAAAPPRVERCETGDLEALYRDLLERPFDLEAGPVLRAVLVSPSAESHVLMLALLPLCGDRVTLENLVAEVAAAYGGPGPEPEEDRFSYLQFAAWRNAMLEDPEERELHDFWREEEAAEPPPVRLPGQLGGSEPPAVAMAEAAALEVSAATASRIELAAENRGASVEGFLLAVWQVLLLRSSSESEVVVGELWDFRDEEVLDDVVGALASFLPVRVKRRAHQRFEELWAEAEERREAVQEMAEGFVWGGRENLETGRVEPIDWGFEAFELPAPIDALSTRFSVERCDAPIDRCRLSWVARRDGGAWHLALHHDPASFERVEAERLADQLHTLLEAAASRPEERLGRLPLLSRAERRQLTDAFQPPPVSAPPAFFHRLVVEAAARQPEAPAIRCEGLTSSYGELAERSARLAARLRRSGVGPDVAVGVCLERSIDLIVALIAVLRAGGAYAVLDPDQPPRRLASMAGQLGGGGEGAAPLVIASRAAGLELDEGSVRTLWIDEPDDDVAGGGAAVSAAGLDLDSDLDPESLAYVVFTSGSTGEPKGVAVSHRQLDAYRRAAVERLELPPGGRFATVSTFAADLGNTMVFPALASGGCLHVATAREATNPLALEEAFGADGIDALKLVPSHLEALLAADPEAAILPRGVLVLGGELLRSRLAEQISNRAPGLRVFNHYGPSETTVGVLCGLLGEVAADPRVSSVPIGRPLAGARAYVLDRELEPVPVWAAGELYIGGATVSRGYLGQPRATAAVFVPDPFGETAGGRLYRSGDLVRHLPAGAIEFLGRRDHQVKLHGFRVELGEIRGALSEHPEIRDAVAVVAREGERTVLVAYYVARRPVDVAALREGLRERLPEAALPNFFQHLRRLPLTPNGKLDRDALPSLDEIRRQSASERRVIPPRTDVEKTLAVIWQEILRVPELSVDDNFFELGGDSILAIQLAARLNRVGLGLKPQQLFLHPTLEALARVVSEEGRIEVDQGPVVGEAPPVPVQRWYFERRLKDPQHWNQALLFDLAEPITAAQLHALVAHLMAHHDALRARFKIGDGVPRAVYGAPDEGPPPAHAIDLSAISSGERGAVLEAAAAAAQRTLNLECGPLLRAVLFELGTGGRRLFLAIHHLVVDGVSWRVLAEDLAALGQQLVGGRELSLPPKTTSFRDWAQRLERYASGPEIEAEVPFWRSLAEPPRAVELPRDLAEGANTVATLDTVVELLDQEHTKALLQEVPAVFRTQVDRVLLSALVRVLDTWAGGGPLVVEMEGHGREDLFEDVDLSRTVGWFTSIYPLRLELGEAGRADPAEALRQLEEHVARVPRRGIGWGVLRYLRADAGGLGEVPQPQVKLNYLGQLDAGTGTGSKPGEVWLRLAPEGTGPARSPRGERLHLLEIDAEVIGGRLRMHWRYSRQIHHLSTIERLARETLGEVRELVARCHGAEAVETRPEDFPLADLDAGRMEKIASALERLDDATEDDR